MRITSSNTNGASSANDTINIASRTARKPATGQRTRHIRMVRMFSTAMIAWLLCIMFVIYGASYAIMCVCYHLMKVSNMALPWPTVRLIDSAVRATIFTIWFYRRKKSAISKIVKDYRIIDEDFHFSVFNCIMLWPFAAHATYWVDQVTLFEFSLSNYQLIGVFQSIMGAFIWLIIMAFFRKLLKIWYEEDQKDWQAANRKASKDGYMTFQEFVRSSVPPEPESIGRAVRHPIRRR